ncbi:hypothetical protein SCHPADRAFT_827310 [Schizopora paradoxa]|uniref:Uncharacterized protein n=1 Tax=Schizopora paradoxa TaxID=27342 RepID=A0A0H2RQR7_9AGAM|nr:hypothetical protein SCHPADRAFT_827310 [Schizopora paradoxa]
MSNISVRERLLRSYMIYTALRDLANPPYEQDPDEVSRQLIADIETFRTLRSTRYLAPRIPVQKCGNILVAFEYAQDEAMHPRFCRMLRCQPRSFQILHTLIKNHPVFQNKSNNPQTPVDIQLAITLYRMGRFGNGASVGDISCNTGFSEGSEVEKSWVDGQVGFVGPCRDGIVQHDGTLVTLYIKPSLNGDAYFSRKSTYSLNIQVSLAYLYLLQVNLLRLDRMHWVQFTDRQLLSWVHWISARCSCIHGNMCIQAPRIHVFWRRV